MSRPSPLTLLVATRNPNKTVEIRALLPSHFTITDLCEHPDIQPPSETGSTFAENAILKAVGVSRIFDGPVIADDSGLEVDALGGAPGVFSARYAGPDATDATNCARLIEELAKTGPGPHTARFRCVIALAVNGRLLSTFEGTVEGRIVERARGTGGFGYDPLFVPDGFDQTFGELPADQKNQLSHRAQAVHKLAAYLATTNVTGT